MPYPTRRTQLHGYGVVPVAAIVSVASSAVGGLFSRPRLASGVPKSIYDDEVNDVNTTAAQGAAALQAFINTQMLASSGTPWGTRYAPESITYARSKLAGLPAPTPQAVSQAQAIIDAATAQVQQQIAAGNIPADTAAAIAAAAQRVQQAAQTAGVTGSIRTATGLSPLMLAGGALVAFLLLRKK